MKKSIACLVVGVVMSMHSFGGNLTQTQFENKMLFFTQILNKRCLIFQLKTFEVY